MADFSLSLSLSKRVTYLGYNAYGEYGDDGDIYILNLYLPSPGLSSYRITSISNTDYLQKVSDSGYSTNPYVTVAVKGYFGSVSSFTFNFTTVQQNTGSTYTYSCQATVVDAGERKVAMQYHDFNGNVFYTSEQYSCSNSTYIVRTVIREEGLVDNDNLLHDVLTWKYEVESTTYVLNGGQRYVFANSTPILLYPLDAPLRTVYLTVYDYPTVGSSRSYSANQCKSGSGATNFTIPSNPSDPNRTFNRFANQSGSITYTAGQQIEASSDYTIYARWTANVYVIDLYKKVKSTDAPVLISSTAVTYPDTYSLPSSSESGYTFNGWKLNDSGNPITGTFQPTADNTINKTASLYTSFTPVEYTIVFNVPSGATQPSSVTLQYGQSITMPSSTKTHCNLDGWYDAQSGGNKVKNAGETYAPSGAGRTINLYAQFTGKKYTLKFAINQSGTNPSSVSNAVIQYPSKNTEPSSVSLPTLQLSYYSFNGWIYNGTTYTGTFPSNWDNLSEPANNEINFTSSFTGNTYTITYKDATGSTEKTDTVVYNGQENSNVPSAPSRPAYTFIGWYNSSGTQIIPPNKTTYRATSNITLTRRYTYTRTLTYESWTKKFENILYPNTITLPKWNSTTHSYNTDFAPTNSGNRVSKWKDANSSTEFDGVYTPNLNQNITTLNPVWVRAELISITIPSSISILKGATELVTATVSPDDWIGILDWNSTDDNNLHFIVGGSGDRQATVTGREPINDPSRNITASKTPITSNTCVVIVTNLIPVKFYTTDDNGLEQEYIVYSVYASDNTWTWVNFPDGQNGDVAPPTRTGYVFAGWIRKDNGLLITRTTNIPQYPIDCIASWMPIYTPADRDRLILQLFNREGNAIIQSLDMGIIRSIRESFTTTTSPMPTPTMSSENTFITDLSCTETISISIIRKNPINPNDNSDNPLNWSNGNWIKNVRKLVDRWQSDTDGIKVLYLPRDMQLKSFNGEDVCVGSNYDMLGYVLPASNNIGLLYDGGTGTYDKVLLGYNALITSYYDSFTAESVSVVGVTMTFTLGGMVSQYQSLRAGLLQ